MISKINNNILSIEVDTKIYPLEAIFGAAYVFIDKAYIFLDSKKKHKIEIQLKSKTKTSSANLTKMLGEFENELLHYVHRMKLSKHNKQLREYIVERALYSAINKEKPGLEQTQDDDDPLGISSPWE